MLRAVEGIGVLIVLSVFFAYLLTPALNVLRLRLRTRRRRPISRTVALLVIYAILFVPAALAWRLAAGAITHWVHVTAPAAVDRLFSGENFRALDTFIAGTPFAADTRTWLNTRAVAIALFLEREARTTLHDMIAAAPHAMWLTAAPVIAFLLLTLAPTFRRSTLRILPHGHIQWRTDEFLQDVNSALAGYVRAQSAAAVIVGTQCVIGFWLLGLPSAVSMGVAAGVMELVPAVGPLTAMLVSITLWPDRALSVAIFLGCLRLLQDYVIYPRLVRRGMHLSTWAVIITIWCGAAIAGAAGVIMAIPLAGVLSVAYRHWREYRELERFVRDHQHTHPS